MSQCDQKSREETWGKLKAKFQHLQNPSVNFSFINAAKSKELQKNK